MAQKKKGGFINRLIVGTEKSEEYARASLPSNRWELFWDIFKGRFGKLFIINLLTLLFFIPLILLIFFRYVGIVNLGTIYPFSQPFGNGYMASLDMTGFPEAIVFQTNLFVFLFMPIALMIAAVGLSGGAYVIRNMVWTEGIFVANDFWRGIKQNIKQMLVIALAYALVFYVTVVAISFCEQSLAVGTGMDWLFTILEILSYLILILFSVMTLHMITMTVTYQLKFRHLLKNAFLFTIGFFPHNLIFVICAAIPYICFLFSGFFFVVGIILVAIFGLSLPLLIWTDFSQWIYDRYLNDKIPGAKKNRGIYEKVKSSDAESLKKYREQVALASRNSLNSRPIKPITDDDLKVAELPTYFNRSDIEKLNESKQAIYDDHKKYVEEHKNDEEFQFSEADKLREEQETERQKRIEKAKKELSKRKKK